MLLPPVLRAHAFFTLTILGLRSQSLASPQAIGLHLLRRLKRNSLAPASQAKEKFKSSGGFWPPELDKVTLDESVTVTQSELNQASGNDGRCDLTKRSRRSDVDTSRETKDRMVPHIEHIHAETKVMRFLDPDVLD